MPYPSHCHPIAGVSAGRKQADLVALTYERSMRLYELQSLQIKKHCHKLGAKGIKPCENLRKAV